MKKITLLLLFLFISVSGYSQLFGNTEGFETFPAPSGPLPQTWTLGTGNWAVFERNTPATVTSVQNWGLNTVTATPYQGTNFASVSREQIGAGSTSEDFLVTSVVSVPATGVTELHFWTRMFTSGNQQTIYKVMVASANQSQTDPNSYIDLQQWTEPELIVPTTNFNVWTEKTVNLSAYAGNDIYVAFVKVYTQPTGTLDGDRWLIDNVGVNTQCTAPVPGTTTAITSTTANLTWSNPSGATTWEIEIVPAAGTPTGIPTYPPYSGTLPFMATGLTPNTAYKYYVRAICSSGFTSPWSTVSANFTTLVAPPVCGGNLVDSGGVGGNYANNENSTTTVLPVNPGDLVTVTFTAFNTQAGSDILRIYDGANATFPLLASLSGTALPPSFTSTAVSGALTFVFTSNNATNAAGYAANITCNPPPTCRIPTAVNSNTITTTSVILDWTQPANPDTSVATAWQVLALACGSPTPGAGATGWVAAGSNPFTLSGLTPATCYDIYVRAVCGASTSGWSTLPRTITTLVAPPVCGGNFVDSGGTTGNYGNNANLTTVICPVNTGDVVTVTFTAFNTQAGTDLLKVYNGGDATAPLLATLSGTTLPPAFISSAANGCLTFVFTSNGNTVASGWLANITCGPPPPCTTPIIVTTGTVTYNSVPLSWTQPANADSTTASAWQVLALPCGSPAPGANPTTGILVNAGTNTNFPLTGLAPLTCYDIYIRAVCSGTSSSAWTSPVTINTPVAPPICGGNFLDPGITADYGNNLNSVVTICPTNTGDIVTVTFTSFNTEANWDGLYVYDGNSVTAPLIPSTNGAGNGNLTVPGSYWGTTIPGPFTSSSADGCLTFRFISDTTGTRAGWTSDITCTPPPSCRQPSAYTANLATVTHNSVGLNWSQPTNPDNSVASAWQILALPCGSPAPGANPTTGIMTNVTSSTPAPPYTLTGLTPQTCYDIYIRAVCSGTDNSAWSGPRTITTKIAPPVCGGTFVDVGGSTADYPTGTTDNTVVICPTNTGDVVTVTFSLFATEATWDGLYVFDGNSITAPQIPSANGAGNVPGGVAGSFWGTLTGANLPGPFTSSSADGCLTFRFRTDTGGVDDGWLASVTCSPAPNCLKPIALTATNISSTSALLGWTEPSPTTVTQWEVLVLPFGSPAPLPTTTGGVIVSSNPSLITGLLPGTQYTFYVRGICPTSGTSLWSVGANFLTLIINDNCDGAIFAPVNGSAVCQQVTPGTITGATASVPAPTAPCVGNANDDVWFQFIATNLYLNVALQNVVGSVTNLNFAAYSGQCGTLTQIFCSANNSLSGVLNNLVVGQTYYIRVYSNSAASQTVNFDLCISTPSTCPTGSTVCSLTNYANTTGVVSLGTIGCLTTSPNPAYFTVQVATTGPINFLLTQSTTAGGAPNLDVDYAAWGPFPSQAAGCAAISGGQAPGIGVPVTQTTGCSFSAASTENLNIANAIAGQFYIVLITNYSDDAGFINLTQTNATSPGHGTTNCCPDAYFKYAPAAFCRVPSTPNPTPIITVGSLAGVFSSTTGLVFVDSGTNTGSTTGQINIMASAPGNYVVTNTLAATASCVEYTKAYTINITEPTSAVINYSAPAYCKSVTTLQPVTQTGTSGGSYSAIPNIGLSINPTTGEINPSLSSPGVYTVVYGLPGSICTTGNPSTTVEIYPLPNIIQPAPVAACNTYTLPALTVGDYYSQSQLTGPATTPLDISVPITTNQTIYIYAISANGCPNEKSFTVTINTVPDPTFNITLQPTCAAPSGTVVVTSPVNAGGIVPTNLFISEVTDANTGSLTYVEIYNGTGAPVNLANYKLRTFNNGSGTVTAGCDNILSGTLANNSVHVVSVGSSAITTGVIPNQTFNGCTGINQDDCIKLTTLTNTVIDVFGRTDGVPFTPLNQPGYTYRRLAAAPHPTTTWNAADWTALDPEDYSNVGSYAYLTSNYEYALDSNPYQSSTTFTGVTPGNHTITAHDLITGCYSNPVAVNLTAVGQIPSVTTFSYTTPVCQLATTNPLPDTSATGFTTGGTYSVVPSTTTGLALNPTTGEIDLSNPLTLPGTYTIKYEVPFNTATCQAADFSTATIVISTSIPAEVGFSYTSPICQIAQPTLAPTLATGFVTGGTFTISPATGVTIDPATGVLTLGATATPGTYDITYTVGANAANCQALTTSAPVQVIISTPTPAEVGFSYTTPICQIAQATLAPSLATGFVTGGTFAISPATGVTINPSTGVLTLGTTATPGTYDITYTVAANPSTCQALTTSAAIQVIISPTTPANVLFSYASPVCVIAQPTVSPTLDAGFVAGGTFTANPSTNISINASTGVITLGTSTQPGTYTITYTVAADPSTCQGLTVSNPIQIVISPTTLPNVGFHYDSICPGETINSTPILDAGFVTGGVFGPTPLVDPVTGEVNVNLLTAGVASTITYDLAANTTTCESANNGTATITKIAPIVIELNGGCQNVYVLNALPVNGSFNPETATFSWQNADGPVPGGNSQSLNPVPDAGTYTVIVTVDGCSTESAPFEVTSVACQIQKGISVNNDGRNDTFDLTGFDVKQLTIFNRLGMKVYSRANYVNEWGGKSDGGDELPDGTYFYVIDKNTGKTETGWIYINRAQ